MIISFTVEEPVSINRMYARRGGSHFGKQLFITCAGKAFKLRAQQAAIEALARSADWPRDPWRVLKAELSLQLYDVRFDPDACRKALRDSCEGVLYRNDRIVQDGPSPLPIKDGLGRRVVVIVRLLELASVEQGQRIRQRVEADRVKRAQRPRRKKSAA